MVIHKTREGGHRTPYFLLPIVQSERQEREARGITPQDYGKSWISAYAHMLGEPPDCYPGETLKAQGYLAKIETVIEHGGWTPSERGRLYRKRDKWLKRAQGRDARFMVVGTRVGGLTESERRELRVWQRQISWSED